MHVVKWHHWRRAVEQLVYRNSVKVVLEGKVVRTRDCFFASQDHLERRERQD